MLDMMGLDDAELEHIEIRESIKPLLEALPAREKRRLPSGWLNSTGWMSSSPWHRMMTSPGGSCPKPQWR